MKKEWQDIIVNTLQEINPKLKMHIINSSIVSAQNRVRMYITDFDFKIPEDKGIKLKDIIECGCVDREKSYCLDANYWKGGNLKSYFTKNRRQLVFDNHRCIQVGEADIKGYDVIKRVYAREGKSPTLTTMQGGHREPKVICEKPVRVATINDGGQGNRIYSRDGKGITLTSQSGGKAGSGNMLVTSPIRDKSKTVRSGGRGSYDRHEWDSVDKLHWRKLTPLECERLQTLPDNYTNHVSNSQRYKMIGNGFTVDVIAHIIKGMAA